MKEEWGVPPEQTGIVTCVRRFGRPSDNSQKRSGREHITGVRMATTNGHEVLMCKFHISSILSISSLDDMIVTAYSADGVYLYSTKDEAKEPKPTLETSVLRPNKKARSRSPVDSLEGLLGSSIADELMEEDIARFSAADTAAGSSHTEDEDVEIGLQEEVAHEHDEQEGDEEEDEEEDEAKYFPAVPVVMPRRKYSGACNVETVKDGVLPVVFVRACCPDHYTRTL